MSGIIIDVDTNSESAKRDLKDLNKGLKDLINSSRESGKSLGQMTPNSFKNLSYSANRNKDSMERLNDSTKKNAAANRETASTASMLAGAMDSIKTAAISLGAAFLAVKGVGAFNKVADDLTNVQNRLKLVIKDTDQLLIKQRQLFGIARETRTEFASTVNTFTDFATSMESSGIAAGRLNNVMRTLNKGIALSGSSVEGVKGALMQLGQGIGSGTLRGEELNSVLEQMKYVGQGLSRELGMTVGQLREFASNGKLTTEVVISALEAMSERTSSDFADTSATAAQAVQQMNEAIGMFFADINKKAGFSAGFAKRIMTIGDAFATGADKIFAQSYLMEQSLKNFIDNLSLYDASSLVLKGVIEMDISPVDAYQKYKIYKALKERVESVRTFLGMQKSIVLDVDVDGGSSIFDAFKTDGKDLAAAEQSVGKFSGVVTNLKRLTAAAGDAIVVTGENIRRLVPRVVGPLVNTFDSIGFAIKSFVIDMDASTYDTLIPFGRALENINQRLSLFSNGDNKLERAWVDLFKSDSLLELTQNLEKLNVVRRQLRWDDKSFLGRELGRSIRGAGYGLQSFMIELGLLENQLIRVRDTRFDRLYMYFDNIQRVVRRVYTDVFATTLEPIAKKTFLYAQLWAETFFDAISNTLNATSGAWLADSFINGFVNGTQAIFDFWEAFESGQTDILGWFGSKFSQGLKDSIFNALQNVVNFVKQFFGNIGSALAEGVSGSFSDGFVDVLTTAVAKLKRGLQAIVSTVAGYLSNINIGSSNLGAVFSIDTTALAGAAAYIQSMFAKILSVTGDLAATVFRKVKQFCEMVKDEFFLVYDEVVGHSYWPDTIDEINAYTDKLLTSENRITDFGKTIKEKFAAIYDTLLGMGIGAGGVVADFAVRVSKVEFGDVLTSLKDGVVGAITAAIAIAFGDFRFKAIGYSYFASMLNNALGGAFTVFTGVAGAAAGNIAATFAKSFVDGIVTGMALAVEAIPAFVKSFALSLSPLQGEWNRLFDLIPTLTNTLLWSIASITAAWMLFSSKARSTVVDLIFGKEAKGKKPAKEGIVDYVKAMFPILDRQSSGIMEALFPNKKLAMFGAAALSTAMLDSISMFQAAQVGLPLLAFAMLGKDNGAGLARSMIFVVEGIYGRVAGIFKQKIMDRTGPGHWLYDLLAPSPASVAGTKGAIGTAFDSVKAAITEKIFNMRRNADAFGAGKMSFWEMFNNSATFVGPMPQGTVKGLKESLNGLLTAVLDIKLPGGSNTLGSAMASMSATVMASLASMNIGLTKFKATLVRVFSAGWSGIVGAVLLLKDGLAALFSLIANRYAIFAVLTLGLSGAAFAASDAAAAMNVITTNGTQLIGTLAKITVGIAAMGVAYRAFIAFSEAKSIRTAVKAGTYVADDFDEGLVAFRKKRSVDAEKNIAQSVQIAKDQLLKKSMLAERAMIFASEADRLNFRKDARERNEQILSRYQSMLAAQSAKSAITDFTLYEAEYKKSQDRIKKIGDSGSASKAGLLGASFYFKDIFDSGIDAAKRFRDFVKTKVMSAAMWNSGGNEISAALATMFRTDQSKVEGVIDSLDTVKEAFKNLRDGEFKKGFSNLFGGVKDVASNTTSAFMDMFSSIATGVGSVRGAFSKLKSIAVSAMAGLWAVLRPLVMIVAKFAGYIAIAAGILAGVGVLAVWLFGPGDSFIDNLEWAYDKIRAIIGLQASTNGGRKMELTNLIGGKLEVGDQQVDFSSALRGIDYGSMSDVQFQVANETANETKEAFKTLNTLFAKQGKFTDENLKELERIRNEQKDILLRMPQKESESYSGSVATFDKSIVDTTTSVFDMLRNFPLFGWKPVLKETYEEIGAFQKGLTYLIDSFTSWPAIIGGAVGLIFGPVGGIIGAGIGGLVSMALDAVMAGFKGIFNWIAEFVTNTSIYQRLANAAATAGDYINEAGAYVSDGFDNLGKKISTEVDNFLDSLKNKPTQLQLDMQQRFKTANGELPRYSTALGGDQQADLQRMFDEASDAATRYATLMQQGFRGTNADSLQDFTKKLEKARVEYEKTMETYEQLTARLNPLAKALALTKQVVTEQKTLFESTKTLFDYDFGKDDKEFIGNKQDMSDIKQYIDSVRYLQDQLKTTYDLSERRRIRLEIETVRQQMIALGDFIKGSAFLNQDIEIKAKLTGDFASADNLKNLFFRAPEAYKSLDDLSRQYTQTMVQVNAITTDTPIGVVKLLIEKIADLRVEAVKKLPGTNIFSEINAQITALGGQGISTNVFGNITEAGFKKLGDAAQSVNVLKTELTALEQLGAKPSLQVAKMKQLDNATRDYLSTVDQFKADGLKAIVDDKSLGNAQKAFTVAKQLGVTMPEGVQRSSKAMGRWAAIQLDMALTQIKLNKLIAEGGEGADAQVAALGEHWLNMQRQLTAMSDTSVFSMDSLIGKLQETGLAVNDVNFSRLSASAQKSLAGIGTQLEAISKKMSESSASGLAGAGFQKMIAQRQALLEKARSQLLDAMYTTGDGITEGLNNIGVDDMSKIASLTDTKLKALVGMDKALKMAQFKLADASDLNSYLVAVKQVAALEKQAARASAEATASFSDRAAAINDIFGSELSDASFSQMASGMFTALSSYATQLKYDMEDAVVNGVTAGGDTIGDVFGKLVEATRTGQYLNFFSTLQSDTAAAMTNGAQSAFDKLSGALDGFDISFESFAALPDDLRRAFDEQATALEKYKEAINLPGLTEEMANILNQTGKPIQDILNEFQTEFEAATGGSLSEAFKSPLEKNTAAILEQTAALKTDTAARMGVTLPPIDVGISKDKPIGSVSTAALRRPTIEADRVSNEVGSAIIDANKTLREKLKATVEVTGAKFDAKAMALSNDDQLRSALKVANELDVKQKQLKAAVAAKLPTGELQQQVLVLEDVLGDMSDAINDGALKVREAGKAFASGISSDINTALADALKGDSDKDLLTSVLDTFTNNIIDTFVAGLMDPFTGDDGYFTKLFQGLGETVFSGAQSLFSGMFGGGDKNSAGGNVSSGLGSMVGGLFGGDKDECGGETVVSGLSDTLNSNLETQKGFFEGLGSTFMGGLDSLGGWFSKGFSMLSSSLGGMFSGGGGGGGGGWLGTLLQVGVSAIGGYFTGGASTLGTGTMTGFSETISNVKLATGGKVSGPGTGTSDSIRAMLSNGEFVVNARATRDNLGLLTALNSGMMPAFAEGGLVNTAMGAAPTFVPVAPVKKKDGGGQTVFHMNITGDISRQTKKEIYGMLPQIAAGVNMHNREKNIR